MDWHGKRWSAIETPSKKLGDSAQSPGQRGGIQENFMLLVRGGPTVTLETDYIALSMKLLKVFSQYKQDKSFSTSLFYAVDEIVCMTDT